MLHLIGALSGWLTLARAYPHSGEFHGLIRRFRSLSFNWSNYNGCVTVGTDARGLYLALFSPFRPGHPPIFIPWVDVVPKPVKGWFGTPYLELTFTKAPGIRVWFPGALGQEIAADANRAWDAKSTEQARE
jgi:hypothetical protein